MRWKTRMKSLRIFARAAKALRIYARQEPRKLGHLLIITSMLLSIGILSFIKSHYCSSSCGNLQAPMKLQVTPTSDLKMVTDESEDPSLIEDEDKDENGREIKQNADAVKPVCYETSERSDTCEVQGDVRVQGSSNTIFFHTSASQQEWTIKPYPRKHDPSALRYTTEWTLKPSSSVQQLPHCTENHTVPVMIFSIGGFTGNVFHDFTDVLVPLFISSYQFHGEVQFLASDVKPWWISKYSLILKQLSNYDVLDIDKDEKMVRCYPRAIIGPSFHKELGVDTKKSRTGHSILDFKELLRKAYGLERHTATAISDNQGVTKNPRLLIISRKNSRAFLNEQEMMQMAMSLGFDVKIGEPGLGTVMERFARLVNSADVLLGVHGAGLTNMVFLPSNAVVVQIIPFGRLEWVSRQSFKEPTMDMRIKYLDYVIQEDESSLIDQYPRDHPVLKDPMSVHGKGWNALMSVYLDKQNVKPHLGRLRKTLLVALNLLPHNSSAL